MTWCNELVCITVLDYITDLELREINVLGFVDAASDIPSTSSHLIGLKYFSDCFYFD